MLYLYLWAKSLLQPREEGQGLVEYVLILALIAIAAIVVMGLLGNQIEAVFNDVENAIANRPS